SRGVFFQMTAETKAHGGEEFVLVIGLAAGGESFVQSSCQNRHRNAFVDGGLDGPAALAGIGDAAGELGELRIGGESVRGKIQQPGGDDAAATPYFGDIGEVEFVLILFRIAQRGRFRIGVALLLPNISSFQHPKALGVCRHNAVFDAVVNHLDEMAGPVGTAMQVALFGGTLEFFAARGARDAADTGAEGGENGVQLLNHIGFAANHHAVSTFQSPDAATGSDVDIMNAFGGQLPGAAEIINVI